jgi:hypothetical protein
VRKPTFAQTQPPAHPAAPPEPLAHQPIAPASATATAPPTTNDEPAIVQVRFFSEEWGRPAAGTIAALKELLQPGRVPSPSSVTAKDPTPSLPSAALDAAREQWLNGNAPPFLPTARLLHEWKRERLIDTSDKHTEGLAEEARRARPLATDAVSMMEAAHAAGWERCAPALYVRRGPPVLDRGFHPSVHTDNLFDAHAAVCPTCAKGAPCSVASACNLLAEVSFPFAKGEPPASSGAIPEAEPYNESLATLARELMDLGVLGERDPATITHYAKIFDAVKVETVLSQQEAQRLAADPTGAAADGVAAQRAAAFLDTYEAELKSRSSEGDAGIRRAWEAAQAASGGELKHRLVSDCSGLTDDFLHLPMRYATLLELLRRAKPGARLFKLDLKKGYFLLRLSEAAAACCGVRVILRPGEPPTTLAYLRLPMGASPSAFIFSLLTAIVTDIARHRLPAHVVALLEAYLDDIFLIADSEADAEVAKNTILQLLAELGIPENPKKREGPAASITILGITVDTDGPLVKLPPNSAVKLATLVRVVHACEQRKLPIPAFAIPKLAGNLAWAGAVDSLLPPNTRALAAATKGLHPKWWRYPTASWRWPATPLAEAMAAELKWLANHLSSGALKGQRLLRRADATVVAAATDASGATNTVAVVLESVAFRFVLPDCSGVKLAILESIAMPLLLAHTGLRSEKVIFKHATDALGACFWSATGRARDDCANDLQRVLAHGALGDLPRVDSAWLGRGDNYIADRGAAAPWRQLIEGDLAGTPMPARLVEVQVSGLPCDFLASWASGVEPGFAFSRPAWEQKHSRGSTP